MACSASFYSHHHPAGQHERHAGASTLPRPPALTLAGICLSSPPGIATGHAFVTLNPSSVHPPLLLFVFFFPSGLIHLHIWETYRQIKTFRTFYRYWTYLQVSSTHTADPNGDGDGEGDHMVAIIFVLYVFRNKHKIQILVSHYFI